MAESILPILILTVPSLFCMGAARLSGFKQWYVLLAVSILGAVFAGRFLAAAATAMATAVDPAEAKWRGTIIGGAIGIVVWGVVQLVGLMISKLTTAN